MKSTLKLHVGGETPKVGWKILNVIAGPNVDFVGNCTDLSQFADNSVAEIYISHVLEHLDYRDGARKTLAEFHRVLEPGGVLRISVPDLEVLCHLLLAPFSSFEAKYFVMQMIYGGQSHEHDFHRSGYTFQFLGGYLKHAQFTQIRRVKEFGLFQDTSNVVYNGVPISLNVEASKPAGVSPLAASTG